MGNIFAAGSEKSLMIYSQGNHIFLLVASGETPCRPTLLARDFASDLSETVYNQTLYYTYLNIQQDIMVKSILDNTVLFTLTSTEAIHYSAPHMVTFANQLLLFYVIKNPLNGDFMIKGMIPFEHDHIPDTTYLSGLSCSFPQLPTVKTFLMDNKLLILFCTAAEYRIFLLTEHLQVLELEDGSDKMALLAAKDSLLASQTATIESIKTQYNELMQTASQYREEARKWYTIARGHH